VLLGVTRASISSSRAPRRKCGGKFARAFHDAARPSSPHSPRLGIESVTTTRSGAPAGEPRLGDASSAPPRRDPASSAGSRTSTRAGLRSLGISLRASAPRQLLRASPARALQSAGEAIYFIADYHSMTSVRDGAERRRSCATSPSTTWPAASTVAAVLYRQSTCRDLRARCCSRRSRRWPPPARHSTRQVRRLEADHGLFAYPVLMAATSAVQRRPRAGRRTEAAPRDDARIATTSTRLRREVFACRPHISRRGRRAGVDGRKMTSPTTIRSHVLAENAQEAVMAIVTDSTPVEERRTRADALPALSLFATKRSARRSSSARSRWPRLRRREEGPGPRLLATSRPCGAARSARDAPASRRRARRGAQRARALMARCSRRARSGRARPAR